MVKMTKKEALELTRTLWRWLARNPTKDKSQWPGWPLHGTVQGHCFCCEYSSQQGYVGQWSCDGCPLIGVAWKNDCAETKSPYNKWNNATADYLRTRHATRLADACTRALEAL
jgi:hypothetical protein